MGELGLVALPAVSYLILYLYNVGIYLSVGGNFICSSFSLGHYFFFIYLEIGLTIKRDLIIYLIGLSFFCRVRWNMPKITYIKNGQKTEIETDNVGASLLDIAQENGVDMDHACGGNGICTTCMVQVKSGSENLSDMTEREEIMGMDPEDPTLRLGCQCQVSGDVEVELAY